MFTSYLLYIFIRAYLHAKSIFKNSSNPALAKQFQDRDPEIGDRLLNALQLEESLDEMETNKDLAECAIRNLDSKLDKIPISCLYDPVSNALKKMCLISIGIAIACTIIMNNSLLAAFIRLIQPTHEFTVPLPFTLRSLSQNQQVLSGDIITISIAGYGELPDSISIKWVDKVKSGTVAVVQENEV